MLSLALTLCLAQSAPVFVLHPLGVLGGEDDSGLSSYVLGMPAQPEILLLDAGNISRGLYTWKLGGNDAESPSQHSAVLQTFLRGLSGVLISHSHLDHWVGLGLEMPTLMAAHRSSPLPIFALPETVDALKQHAFTPPLWADFSGAVKFTPVAPGTPTELGGFSIETVPLAHPVPSAAFVIGKSGAQFIYFGDTGPTEAIWKRAQPLLAAHSLRAIAIEVSFTSDHQALALASGHLTPALLLGELAKLTGTTIPDGGSNKATVAQLAPRLKGVTIITTHIKATDHDAVLKELDALKSAGLPLLIPEVAKGYTF